LVCSLIPPSISSSIVDLLVIFALLPLFILLTGSRVKTDLTRGINKTVGLDGLGYKKNMLVLYFLFQYDASTYNRDRERQGQSQCLYVQHVNTHYIITRLLYVLTNASKSHCKEMSKEEREKRKENKRYLLKQRLK
jgi:hypothetical protein